MSRDRVVKRKERTRATASSLIVISILLAMTGTLIIAFQPPRELVDDIPVPDDDVTGPAGEGQAETIESMDAGGGLWDDNFDSHLEGDVLPGSTGAVEVWQENKIETDYTTSPVDNVLRFWNDSSYVIDLSDDITTSNRKRFIMMFKAKTLIDREGVSSPVEFAALPFTREDMFSVSISTPTVDDVIKTSISMGGIENGAIATQIDTMLSQNFKIVDDPYLFVAPDLVETGPGVYNQYLDFAMEPFLREFSYDRTEASSTLSNYGYLFYIRDTQESDAVLEAGEPSSVLTSTVIHSIGDTLKDSYYTSHDLVTTGARIGKYYFKVVPYFSSFGPVFERGSDWVEIDFGGSAPFTFPTVPTTGLFVEDGVPPYDFDFSHGRPWFQVEGTDEQESSLTFSNYAEHEIIIYNDPEILDESGIYVDGREIAKGPAIDQKITGVNFTSFYRDAFTWDTGLDPTIYIDDLIIFYPRHPVIEDAYIYNSIEDPFDPGTRITVDRSGQLDIRARVKDIIVVKFFANFITDPVTVIMENLDGSISQTHKMRTNEDLVITYGQAGEAVFRVLTTAPAGIEEGEKMKITIKANNLFVPYEVSTVLHARYWKHDVVNPTSFSISAGKISTSFDLIITDGSTTTFHLPSLVDNTEFIFNSDLVTSLTPDKGTIVYTGDNYAGTYVLTYNYADLIGIPAFGTLMSYTMTYQIACKGDDEFVRIIEYDASYSGHYSKEEYFQGSVEITTPSGPVLIDDQDIATGFSVQAIVNDQTGLFFGTADLELRLESPSGNSMTGSMNNPASGLYEFTIPFSWFDEVYDFPGSYKITCFFDNTTARDEVFVTVNLNRPSLSIISPDSSGGALDSGDLELVISTDHPIYNVANLQPEYIDAIYILVHEFGDPSSITREVSFQSGPDKFINLGSGMYELNEDEVDLFKQNPLSPGNYTTVVKVTDNSGLTATVENDFIVGEYSPVISTVDISMDEHDGKVWNGTMQASFSVDTNSELVNLSAVKYKVLYKPVDIFIDYPGSSYDTTLPGFPSSAVYIAPGSGVKTFSTTSLPEGYLEFDPFLFDNGTYKIRFKVETTYGNFEYDVPVNSDPSTKSFVIAHEPPKIGIENPRSLVEHVYVTESGITFNGTITDANGDLQGGSVNMFYNVTGLVGGTTVTVVPNTALVINGSGNYEFTLPVTTFTPYSTQLFRFSVSSRDSKMSPSTFVTADTVFKVDTSAPAILITTTIPGRGYFIASDVAIISASGSDSVGLDIVNFTIRDRNGALVYESSFVPSGVPGATESFSESIICANDSAFNVLDNTAGKVTVTWAMTNKNGRVSTLSMEFYIDRQKPKIAFVDPEGVSFQSTPVTMYFTMDPPVTKGPYVLPVQSTSFSIYEGDGDAVIVDQPVINIAGNLYSLSFDFNLLNGTVSDHDIDVTTTLDNGYSKTNRLLVKLDFDIPMIGVSNATNVSISPEVEDIDFELAITDSNDDVEGAVYSASRVTFGSADIVPDLFNLTRDDSLFTGSIDFEGEYGIWNIEVIATDSTGLESSSTFKVVRLSPDTDVSFRAVYPVEYQQVNDTLYARLEVLAGQEIVDAGQYKIRGISDEWNDMLPYYDENGTLFFEVIANVSSLPPGHHFIEFRLLGFFEGDETTSIVFLKLPGATELDAPVLNDPVISGMNVTISWDAVTGANLYYVYRSTINFTSSDDATLISIVEPSSYTDADLENGTYYYAVIAANDDGGSPLSSTVMAVVNEQVPSILDLIIQQIVAFITLIISLITGLLGLGMARGIKKNKKAGKKTTVSCLINPGSRKCKIDD
jgi:hypothetical protein